jgi:hypothetical protein
MDIMMVILEVRDLWQGLNVHLLVVSGYQEHNMAQLSDKIRAYLDRKVDFTKDVILQDDGDGA